MVTVPVLHNTFGPVWKPTYSKLNAFEQYCKDNWGNPFVSFSDTLALLCNLITFLQLTNVNGMPVKLESHADLFK